MSTDGKCFIFGLEKSTDGVNFSKCGWVISGLEKSPLGANKSTIRTFLPDQNATFIGRNVLLVLTFIFFEPHRGSRGLPLAFSDCLMYFFHFRFSGVDTSKPFLGLIFLSK